MPLQKPRRYARESIQNSMFLFRLRQMITAHTQIYILRRLTNLEKINAFAMQNYWGFITRVIGAASHFTMNLPFKMI